MGPFSMVVMIILIVTIGRIVQARYAAPRQENANVDSAEAMRLRGEVQQLKERIQVLERVVTDNHASVDLDREIERLRDR